MPVEESITAMHEIEKKGNQRIFKPYLQTDDNTGFRMQISAFKVFSIFSDPVDIFRCEQCGRVTSDNVGNVCPTYRCTGKLVKFDIDSLSDDHYFKLYNNLDQPFLPMKFLNQ